MNVGIIVYSGTGNTLSIAQRLKGALEAKGHSAELEQITVEGEIAPNRPVVLKTAPAATIYEAVILAAPVMAFSLNPVMKSYLKHMGDLSGEKSRVYCDKAASRQLDGRQQGDKGI